MKKTLITLFTLIILVIFSLNACAQSTDTTIPGNTTAASDPAQDITNRVNEIICTLINVLTLVAAGIAALAIMFAGIKYMTSQDDPGARNNAKNTIIYAIIGLAIVLMACPLIDYIVTDTDITPFEKSCTCAVAFGANTTSDGNQTYTTTTAGGGGTSGTTTTQPVKANGQSCAINSECASRNCNNRLCCSNGECGLTTANRCFSDGDLNPSGNYHCVDGIWLRREGLSCAGTGDLCDTGLECKPVSLICCKNSGCAFNGICYDNGESRTGYRCNNGNWDAYSGPTTPPRTTTTNPTVTTAATTTTTQLCGQYSDCVNTRDSLGCSAANIAELNCCSDCNICC